MDQVENLSHLVIAVGLAGGVMFITERVKRADGKLSSWPLAMAMLMLLNVGVAALTISGVDRNKAADIDAARETLQHLLILMFIVLAATALRRLYLAMIESDGTRSNTLAFKFGAAAAVGGMACGLAVAGARSLMPLLEEINGLGPTMAYELAALAAFLATVWAMDLVLNVENSGARETNARLLRRTSTFGGSWMSATATPLTSFIHERGRLATREFPVWEHGGEILCTQETQRGLISFHREVANHCLVPGQEFHEIVLNAKWAKQPNARRVFWRVEAVSVTNAVFPRVSIRISQSFSWMFRRRKAAVRPLSDIEIETGLRKLDTDLLRSAGIDIRVRRSNVVEPDEGRAPDHVDKPMTSREALM